jgi:hypothetical protein
MRTGGRDSGWRSHSAVLYLVLDASTFVKFGIIVDARYMLCGGHRVGRESARPHSSSMRPQREEGKSGKRAHTGTGREYIRQIWHYSGRTLHALRGPSCGERERPPAFVLYAPTERGGKKWKESPYRWIPLLQLIKNVITRKSKNQIKFGLYH